MESYGIIGHPLGHTMSPTLHNWGFSQLGIQARYEAWPTPPGDLPRFMRWFRETNVRGLSVTIPHKLAVMEYTDRITPRAQAVGAVNTLWWDGGELVGDNTDIVGVTAPVAALERFPGSALVLGAGGASRAAVAALKSLGVAVRITNRTRGKAVAVAQDLGIEVVDWERRTDERPDLLVNSTPLGMTGAAKDETPWPGDHFHAGMAAFDLVYTPLETRFLREARSAGASAIQGIEMFLHQGLEQFRLWTGREMDPQVARGLLLAALS
jgi:shikimate dehydrogenase